MKEKILHWVLGSRTPTLPTSCLNILGKNAALGIGVQTRSAGSPPCTLFSGTVRIAVDYLMGWKAFGRWDLGGLRISEGGEEII